MSSTNYRVPHDVGNDADDEETYLPCERPPKRVKHAVPVFQWNAAGEGKAKKWRDYSLDVQDLLRTESSGGAETITVEIEGKVYTIDFVSMQQEAHHTSYVRKIWRITG